MAEPVPLTPAKEDSLPEPNAQQVLAVMQQRFPREFEIAVLQATNALLREHIDGTKEESQDE